MQRNRKVGTAIVTGAAALGLALGTMGVGWATNPATTAPSARVAVVSQTAGTDPTSATTEPQEATEEHDPSYASSISAPDDENASEADEAAALAPLATVTADEARDAALAAVPGTAGEVELDNENGAVVYSVEITDSSGSHIDLKVDAGNGAVLQREADDGDNEG